MRDQTLLNGRCVLLARQVVFGLVRIESDSYPHVLYDVRRHARLSYREDRAVLEEIQGHQRAPLLDRHGRRVLWVQHHSTRDRDRCMIRTCI